MAIGVVALLMVGALLLSRLPDTSSPIQSEQPPSTLSPDGQLLVSVMDVGQAQCVVVIAPSGKAMVIDGSRSETRIEEDVVPYLQDHGVTQLDYVMISHPDQDHIGGIPALMELMPVGAYVDPVIPSSNETYAEILEMVRDQGIEPIKARRGMSFDLGDGVHIALLWPVDPLLESGGEPETNENSIVAMIQYGEFSMLVPGDAGVEAEEHLLEEESDDDLQADVLVAGHHGSRTASSGVFLDAVRPESVLISAGFDNSYGHPHDEVIRRLRLRGITIYRTDLDGTIEVRSDGTSYEIQALGTEDRD